MQVCRRERAEERGLDSAGSRQAPVISSCEHGRETWISYKGGKFVYWVAERRQDAAQERHFSSAEELQLPDRPTADKTPAQTALTDPQHSLDGEVAAGVRQLYMSGFCGQRDRAETTGQEVDISWSFGQTDGTNFELEWRNMRVIS